MNDTRDKWDGPFTQPQGLEPAELDRWQRARDQLIVVARRNNWTKTQVTKKADIPGGTLWPWLDGTYGGAWANITDRVLTYLSTVDQVLAAAARIPTAPAYVKTPTSARLTDMLMYAQLMPSMVLGVLGSGMGKTFTADEYVRLHGGAFKVTMRPTTKSVARMLNTISDALEVTDKGSETREKIIGRKLRRNGRNTLLIVDEAQNLTDEAVNQLRFLLDEFKVGIALLGNEELYGRFGDKVPKPAFAQLHRRIGMRLRQLAPTPGDVDTLVSAWGITDPDVLQLARALGRKPGALGQISETLKLAGMYAAGEERGVITAPDLRQAIINRGVED